jgi:peptidoglycan-associated lipoprotein
MKKNPLAVLSSVLLVSLLAACASTPGPEQSGAAVEERTPSAPVTSQPATTPPPTVTTRPVQPPAQQVANPLKDPANILSKRSIYYDLDSDAIKEEYRPMMQAHAKYLVEHRSAKILAQGNADERGSREYNIALGQRRAEGVKRMLLLLGATEAQVESVSLGEEKPRCSTDQSDACLAENRRSDVLYSGEY